MSAIGPKQTRAVALHMSAFGGKADIIGPGRAPLAERAGSGRSVNESGSMIERLTYYLAPVWFIVAR